eukprot:999161-Pelagomonas_calceolata.AAC.2
MSVAICNKGQSNTNCKRVAKTHTGKSIQPKMPHAEHCNFFLFTRHMANCHTTGTSCSARG